MRAAFDADELDAIRFAGEFELIRGKRLIVRIDKDVDGAEVRCAGGRRGCAVGAKKGHTHQREQYHVTRASGPCEMREEWYEPIFVHTGHGPEARVTTAVFGTPQWHHC